MPYLGGAALRCAAVSPGRPLRIRLPALKSACESSPVTASVESDQIGSEERTLQCRQWNMFC
ncbi:hypothetical protein ABH15_04425 [Methanoculleus taiwanensis]|uniref:Uncharacterized protein n=1 Tax=Methanoculleus taiwanensis TaxID=1550565 RepID=A0A498H6Z5_9EURY|nr:hypothetical protein ABH15_04425 [Methanoculleus taiwanensis]